MERERGKRGSRWKERGKRRAGKEGEANVKREGEG